MRTVHLCFLICGLLPIALGYRILGVFPVPLKSHYYLGRALMQGLVDRDNEVTVISPFKEKNPIKNYNEIFIENSYERFRNGKVQMKFDYLFIFLYKIFQIFWFFGFRIFQILYVLQSIKFCGYNFGIV